MPTKKKKSPYDPKVILQAAIEEIDRFTQSEASRLEVDEDGRLVASKESPLEKVMGLARSYIGPLFSEQRRREKAKKLEDLKQAVLNARDIIQSHSALIIKFKEGDDSQRKLADYALSAIQRYNCVVSQTDPAGTAKYDVYNYERQCLLSDEEIKGQAIELPHTLSIKFDSHPDVHPAHKMFKEISQTFLGGAVKKAAVSICPTHKKTLQFMIDTFHMKAIRMMQTHLSHQNSMAEIVPIVKGTPLEIDEESHPGVIAMQQLLEVGPGFFILVSGCFKRNISDPKFLSMPLLDSFRLSFQLSHSGFPYPSQHAGWALGDKWVEAYPLRSDQVPLFQKVDQRKKRIARMHLYDQPFIQKARHLAKLKRAVFDQNRELFIPLFRQLQQVLRQGNGDAGAIVETFIQELEQAASPYDLLVQTGQQIQSLFIEQPIKALEEEWLNAESAILRIGTPQEKFQAASERLDFYRNKAREQLSPSIPCAAYLLHQGKLLGEAFQSIALQYLSEKMGFSPPLLNDFERRLQLCAFQQLMAFLDECENWIGMTDPGEIKNRLADAWTKDLAILQSSSMEEGHSLPLAIIDELEFYFIHREVNFTTFGLRENSRDTAQPHE